ncbi:hypothetical protein M9Y10_031156 [Tritrichomonas musculus]|uniref:Uncharacterized protein n=1 Tax=Tritrichomonas musculus TaxID=1915356 RepID=A0ABR2H3P6_9EUKA
MKDISKLNTDYFNIQIQIIFEVFAQKIDQLIHNKFYQFDFFEDEALIKTVRAISKNISSIVIFEDLYKNDFILKFVMSYFYITSIDNASIENSIENDHKLNENEINNIKATIVYLSSLKDDFKVLLFDFENPSNCEFSIKIFVTFFSSKSNKTIEIFEETIEIEKQRNEIKSKEKKQKMNLKKKQKK